MAKTWFDLHAKESANRALGIILKAGLKPSDFTRCDSPPSFRIVHTSTQEYFDFGRETGGTEWTVPGRGGGKQQTGFGMLVEQWPTKLELFGEWVAQLKAFLIGLEEYDATPDLWESVHAEGAFVKQMDTTGSENRPFTLDEQRYVAEQLGELKKYILSIGMAQEAHAGEVQARLEYLEEASRRLGRKDWLNVLFSVLVTLVVSGVFAPDRSNELFGMAAALFQTLYAWAVQLTLP